MTWHSSLPPLARRFLLCDVAVIFFGAEALRCRFTALELRERMDNEYQIERRRKLVDLARRFMTKALESRLLCLHSSESMHFASSGEKQTQAQRHAWRKGKQAETIFFLKKRSSSYSQTARGSRERIEHNKQESE
jgi:hypothetical protein